MSSCLQVITTRINELKLTTTQLCPKYITKFLYLFAENKGLLVDMERFKEMQEWRALAKSVTKEILN